MYGPYLNELLKDNPKKELKDQPKWFSCIPCNVVQWKAMGTRSHCFCCGRWGKRGQWTK